MRGLLAAVVLDSAFMVGRVIGAFVGGLEEALTDKREEN